MLALILARVPLLFTAQGLVKLCTSLDSIWKSDSATRERTSHSEMSSMARSGPQQSLSSIATKVSNFFAHHNRSTKLQCTGNFGK